MARKRRPKKKLLDHVIERQIAPQLIALQLREEQGVDVSVAMVTTNLQGEGYLVTCEGCGRQARSPVEPAPGQVIVCPICVLAAQQELSPPD